MSNWIDPIELTVHEQGGVSQIIQHRAHSRDITGHACCGFIMADQHSLDAVRFVRLEGAAIGLDQVIAPRWPQYWWSAVRSRHMAIHSIENCPKLDPRT